MSASFTTSGTTGQPKRFTVDPAQRAADIARIRPPGWAELMSLYNDFGAHGPGVDRDTKWMADKGGKLFRPLATWEATVAQFTANNIEAIFAPPLFLLKLAGAVKGYAPKIMVASGSLLTPDVSKAIRAGLGDNLWCNYSVSEVGTLTGATWQQAESALGCVGMAYPGNEISIVDGEIQARTPIMIHAYADPKLTAARFTADGWFRTGDKGHMDGDLLFYEGRL